MVNFWTNGLVFRIDYKFVDAKHQPKSNIYLTHDKMSLLTHMGEHLPRQSYVLDLVNKSTKHIGNNIYERFFRKKPNDPQGHKLFFYLFEQENKKLIFEYQLNCYRDSRLPEDLKIDAARLEVNITTAGLVGN